MSEDNDGKKSDPIEDVRKGFGLLFRAAKTASKSALKNIPTKNFEEVVVSSAKEVSRAFGNVTQTIEREVFGKGGPPDEPRDAPAPGDAKKDERPKDSKEGGAEGGKSDGPRGPRVGS